jgi:hypothetical protein
MHLRWYKGARGPTDGERANCFTAEPLRGAEVAVKERMK